MDDLINNRFPKRERLRGKNNIEALFGSPKSGFIYPLKYIWSVDEASDSSAKGCSVLVAVPKRNHKRANCRNLLKRRTREAYRLNKQSLVCAVDHKGVNVKIALIYSSKQKEEYGKIEQSTKKIIANILREI